MTESAGAAPYDYSTLLGEKARMADLRELLAAVGGDLECLVSEHPGHAEP